MKDPGFYTGFPHEFIPFSRAEEEPPGNSMGIHPKRDRNGAGSALAACGESQVLKGHGFSRAANG
jgi:hypothetical protein